MTEQLTLERVRAEVDAMFASDDGADFYRRVALATLMRIQSILGPAPAQAAEGEYSNPFSEARGCPPIEHEHVSPEEYERVSQQSDYDVALLLRAQQGKGVSSLDLCEMKLGSAIARGNAAEVRARQLEERIGELEDENRMLKRRNSELEML
jgi:hypothetical protein